MGKKSKFNRKKGVKKHIDKKLREKFNSKSKFKHQVIKEYQHQNQLQETDVGIMKFISQLDGYSGIIKARFSDFQVNEIDLNNEVAKLTDLSIPADFIKKEVQGNVGEVVNSPIDQIPQETWEAIRFMLESCEKNVVELDATNLTKEDRTKIHECVKKVFGKKIVANTGTVDGKKKMTFKKHDGKVVDRRFKWPEDKGEYVHFLVYKECLDTLEACLRIASCLRMPASSLNYAGVKDKRAKTTQWFSVKKVEPWKLIIKTKCLTNIRIGNIVFKKEPLKLGQLVGNKFRIALRNVTGKDDLVEKSLQSLAENGFINYYGLQRFGNDKEVPTFSVGVQLLLGNWKEACQIILKPTKSDHPDHDISKAKKMFFESGDASKALEQFNGNKDTCIEHLLLSGLSKGHSNDFVNALANIPRNTRLLYIHSFQSLVWNLVASERIEKYGLNVVEGDLVLLEEHQNQEDDGGDDQENRKVKTLTLNECCNYTIYDVVLPLPGYNIIYPKNLTECYKEILEKFGLTLEMTKQKVQTYSLSGTYRKLLGKVRNLNWKIMHYNDPNRDLIRSDLEELKGYEEPKDVMGGKYKALLLEFSLNSSSYATMVLREILKTDTSSSFHANLNNYHATAKEKKIAMEGGVSQVDVKDEDDKVGLLCDTEKYEEFKKIVFNSREGCLKRKYELDCTGNESVKNVKTNDQN